MDMIAVGVGANDRLKVLTENTLHPFRTDFVSEFRVTFSNLERLNYVKRFDRRFAVGGKRRIKILMRIMLVCEPKFLLGNCNIFGAIQTRYVQIALGLFGICDIF